jgi:ferric-dicitrate binding protein FerR (iron transport regulator)
MSDHTTGLAPDEGSPVPDAALDTLLAQWVATSPETVDVEAALARVTALRLADTGVTVDPRDELAERRVARHARVPSPRLWQRTGFRIAATLVMALGATALWRGARSPAVTEYQTGTGSSRSILLADGTEVRLGPASSLALDPGFGQDHRHLLLHGEAWFKVAHNERMPFAIRVGATTVEDVGTAFLVRESPEREVSVRVAEGAVRLTTPAASRDSTVLLQAGDGAVASARGITVAPGVVTSTEGAALAAGRLTFTDASLVEVQEALRRWYGVSLIIADSTLASRHVTADFTGEPMSRVAAVLGLTLGVSADAHGDTIELHAAAGVPSRP